MANVKQCECGKAHEYQDAAYGKGKRVVVTIKVKDRSDIHKCTVCGIKFNSSSEPMQVLNKVD